MCFAVRRSFLREAVADGRDITVQDAIAIVTQITYVAVEEHPRLEDFRSCGVSVSADARLE